MSNGACLSESREACRPGVPNGAGFPFAFSSRWAVRLETSAVLMPCISANRSEEIGGNSHRRRAPSNRAHSCRLFRSRPRQFSKTVWAAANAPHYFKPRRRCR
jgi:hypothetical protein